MPDAFKYIRRFEEITGADVPLVGGKNASLGEMYRGLRSQGILVPNGFAITADAYRYVLDSAGAWGPLRSALDGLDPDDVDDLARRGQRAREIVYQAGLPDDLQAEILAAHHRLLEEYGLQLTVAVRSSAPAEDLPNVSFAGQHETYLNVGGGADLLDACRRCFASLFTDRAIHYRIDQGFDHFKVLLSVGVMKMVRSDLAASGVIFSLDTESGFRDVVLVTAAYGLGENVVQGAVDPDEFYVHKPTLRQGYRAVLRRLLGRKQLTMIYGTDDAGTATRNVSTPDARRQRFCITDEEILALADYALRIEEHASARTGHDTAMDTEWAKDGIDGLLYVVQARPETVVSQRKGNILEEYALTARGSIVVEGRSVGMKIAAGPAHVISDPTELHAFKDGDVLVSDTTSPDWEPVMKRAAAVVTNRGGRTCHAAIVARELGIPAVVGAQTATDSIKTGNPVTVSCAEGDVGKVYQWRRAQLPIREGRKRLAVDRQVQLIAGLMVLTGVSLGLTVSPWFLSVAAFFGAGLTFAGATGTCGLALVLMKMPWNRPLATPAEGGGAVCAAGGGAPKEKQPCTSTS